jgi:hypothetical protein
MYKIKPIMLLLLCSVLLLDCNKLGKDEHYTYTVTNYTTEKIEFDIYLSQADYNTNSNIYKKLYFEPDEAKTLDLEPLRDYFFDWHNDNGNSNNWLSGVTSINTPYVQYNPPKINDWVSMINHDKDTAKSIILNTSKTESHWVTAQEYIGGTTPAGAAPFFEITLRKDFTAVLRQKNNSGDTLSCTTNQPLQFLPATKV